MKREVTGTLDPETSYGLTVLPEILAHSNDDTPVPTWQQVTRSGFANNPEMVEHLSRIVGGANMEMQAEEVWSSWEDNVRRSVALLVDKIYHEGWLDFVGPLSGWPWDGGFFFLPVSSGHRQLEDLLDAKSRDASGYTRCDLRDGLAAYLSGWNHRGWRRGWIENDAPFASLHVGLFDSGSAEVHLDLFNPVYTRGAPRSEVIKVWGLGAYNRRLFGLHRRWEGSRYASITRTSANFYHLMRGRVPLSF
jgi:hypothetical protein